MRKGIKGDNDKTKKTKESKINRRKTKGIRLRPGEKEYIKDEHRGKKRKR